MIFFDLPMLTREETRCYNKFHKFLLKNGYVMMQYSIYSKILPNKDSVNWHMEVLKKNLPPDGSVMSLCITEKQYAGMKNLICTKKALDEKITTKPLLIF